ncbi:MAG: ATP-binding protein, partial [Chloroflexota bacterium]
WLSLAQFGVKLLDEKSRLRWLRLAPFGLFMIWLIALIPLRLFLSPSAEQWLTNGGIWARYILLTPASIMAMLGLLDERPRLREMGLPNLARQCSWAAAFLAVTAFAGGLVVPPAPYPPADFLNYSSFFAVTGVPVQVVRAFAALAIAYFIVRVLRVFRIEYDRRLDGAIENQLQAQREALEAQRTAQQAIEAWNRELEARVSQRTHELEMRNRELAALNSIATTISQSLNLSELLKATLNRVLGVVDAPAGAVYLLDPATDELVLELELGTAPWLAEIAAKVPLGQGCVGQAAATGRTVSSARVAPANLDKGEPTSGPTVCVPLLSKGRVLGVMSVIATGGEGLPVQEVDMLEAIAGQVAVAIENARLFDQVQQLAVLEERDRIAREMHDGLAQILGYLNLRIHMAEDLLEKGDREGLRSELQHSAGVTQEAYADVREAILGLRTSITLEQDLLCTLREYLRKFRQNSDIAAELEVAHEESINLTPAAEVQLIRIIQEALTNVRKHARANHARVRLRGDGEMAEVTISDDGRGFDVQQSAAKEGHFGLQTMRERAESVGGTLTISSAPGQGSTITVRLPLAMEGGRVYGTHKDIVG